VKSLYLLLALSYASGAVAAACREGDVKYPAPDAPPITQVGHGKDATLPGGAACFEATNSSATWVTVASVIRTSDNRQTLLARFGAISQLLTVQYWSITEKKWRPLTSAAHAISNVQASDARPDYSPAELSDTSIHYYALADTRLGTLIRYRMQLQPLQPNKIVVETANVDALKKWGITLSPPGSIETLYFLNELSPGVWSYYSITRAISNSLLPHGHDESYINRALALYRYYMHPPVVP
jgi:hypothetical protein